MNLARPAGTPRQRLAMMRLGQLRVFFQPLDQLVVVARLLDAEPREEGHERNHADDGHVVGRRRNHPELMPVLNHESRDGEEHDDSDQHDHACAELESSLLFYLCYHFRLAHKSFSVHPKVCEYHRNVATRQGSDCCYFFFTAFISDSSITGAGPEMPPSLRMRQKWTAIKIEATSGMPMQCQM